MRESTDLESSSGLELPRQARVAAGLECFYPGVPLEPDRIATTSAWVYGLQQNSETRTNLALVNAGLAHWKTPNTFRIELFDGPTGKKVNTIDGITA